MTPKPTPRVSCHQHEQYCLKHQANGQAESESAQSSATDHIHLECAGDKLEQRRKLDIDETGLESTCHQTETTHMHN